MILHDNDYDLQRTIEFVVDGGEPVHDWKTAGKQKKPVTSAPSSPNQTTLEDTENSTSNQPQFNNKQKNYKNNKNETHNNSSGVAGGVESNQRNKETNNNQRSSRNDRSRKFTSPKTNNKKYDNENIEEKFNQMDLQQSESNEPSDYLLKAHHLIIFKPFNNYFPNKNKSSQAK